MEETEHDRLSNKLEIIFYEMPKLEKMVRAYFEGTADLKNLPKEQKWARAFSREVGIIDHESGLAAAAEARAEEIVRSLKKQGVSPEIISNAAGFAADQIETL